MPVPPPSRSTFTNLLTTQRALLDTLCSFLTVTTHHVLFLRRVYPPVSFLATQAYNFPARQNRHPEVCAWINDAIAAVRDQLERNTVDKVAICIFECDDNEVLERWTFDMRSFPSVQKRDHDTTFDSAANAELMKSVNVTDLEANFRAVLLRLNAVSGKMRPLPNAENAPECSFTMTIEVKEQADAPVGRLTEAERAWIVSEPESFDKPHGATKSNTYPLRRLDAGELRLEMYVEESDFKLNLPSTFKTTLERAADLSYGAGSEKFDPENGYGFEGTDINKKPQGGAFTDYQRS